ncbi:MAG: hypothetical protein ACRD8W_10515 [Nitrososphaeraceae archaeon]
MTLTVANKFKPKPKPPGITIFVLVLFAQFTYKIKFLVSPHFLDLLPPGGNPYQSSLVAEVGEQLS